jgi:hypothetical protein
LVGKTATKQQPVLRFNSELQVPCRNSCYGKIAAKRPSCQAAKRETAAKQPSCKAAKRKNAQLTPARPPGCFRCTHFYALQLGGSAASLL